MGMKKERKVGNFDYRLAQLVGILDVFVQALTRELGPKDQLRVNGYEIFIDETRLGANTIINPAGWKKYACLTVQVTDFKTCKFEWAGVCSDRLESLIGTGMVVMHPLQSGDLEIEHPQCRMDLDQATGHYVVTNRRAIGRLRRAVAETNKQLRSIQIR